MCTGLTRNADAVTFTDSRGRAHDLLEAKRVPLKAVASMVNRSYSWVRAAVATGALYPVIERNGSVIEVYVCAVDDWRARQVIGRRATL